MSWGTVGWGKNSYALTNAVMIVLELVQIPLRSRRNSLRELDVTVDYSKALTAKFRWSILSTFRASIMEVLMKLVWLPLYNTQRVS